MSEMADAFARAYKDGQWHQGSGSGSSPANTLLYRQFLAGYMRKYQIRSVLDLGCGDWRVGKLIDWSGVHYHGYDVVPELIMANAIAYGKGWVQFTCADILDVPLPPADLVLCKDLLQHWPDAAISDLISRLSGRRALITYDHSNAVLTNIPAGGYRPLDLRAYYTEARHALFYQSVSHEGAVTRNKVVTELVP